MMPKGIARWYLLSRRRNPDFLQNHINYTNYFEVSRIARRLNWDDLMLKSFLKKIQNPQLLESRAKRLAVNLIGWSGRLFSYHIIKSIYTLRNIFRPEITYQYYKKKD
jgi:hypothetical protein